MNQRRLDPARTMVPVTPRADGADEDSHAEQLMFDKAEFAARVSQLRAKRDELKAELESLDIADAAELERERTWRERQLGYLQDVIDTMEQR
jgi:hypothetical protein